MYKVEWKDKAKKDLAKLDRVKAEKIKVRVETDLVHDPYLYRGKPLTGNLKDWWSFRFQ